MEKLELKHLDFQNNCLVRLTRIPHLDIERVELKNCSLSFNNKEPYLIYKDVTFRLDQIKCYKRPLSDLTKEIEVNGERFVPIERLFELSYDANKSKEYYYEKQINYIRCSHNDTVRHKMIFTNSEQFNRNLYLDVEKLHQWHFDTNGLIEKGLAIDFNTLQNG